ncbi:Uncharacterized protein Fot_52326 [Forsythia ovata]|uniref:Uncharacterized protein n=1 Tax=Forsythia ovata TaxID=205694 RepID=A0ABD1PKE5_9LAMI
MSSSSSFSLYDLSGKSFAQTPQLWRSKEGDSEFRPADLVILSRLKPEFSLSKDHLSFRVVKSSENGGIDQPSDDPPLDPLVDSQPQAGRTKEDASSEIENAGVLYSGIGLSDTCRNSCCPGERRLHLEGVEFGGSRWLWDEKGDVDMDEINITDYDEECDDEKAYSEKDEELDISELRKLVKIEKERAASATAA